MTHLLPKDKEWGLEVTLAVVAVDGGLVHQRSLRLHGEHLPLLLVESHVGVQTHGQE